MYKALFFLRVLSPFWVLVSYPEQMHGGQGSFSPTTQGESNQQRECSVRPIARCGIPGGLGRKYDIRQEGGVENAISSCKMGTISDTGCGEEEEVMYVKCQQRCVIFFNVLIKSNISNWIISL